MTRSRRWLVVLAGIVTVSASTVLLPADAAAQRRGARRAEGRPVIVASRVYRPVYYRSYHPFAGYGGWYGGWRGLYGWSPYYYGQPYPYGRYYYDHVSDARLQVQPKQAQVFVDGYFVGTVDDFDGWSQRLRVEPGEHELEIYLDGYRSYREQVLFRPGATVKIEQTLQPLGAGDAPQARPAPSAAAPRPQSNAPVRPVPPRAPRGEGEAPVGESQDYGAVAVRVQPTDAEVIVDGERWEAPEAGDVTVQLPEGTHRVEVRKAGYRPYSAEIRVRRGETTAVNVSLSR